MLLKVPYTNKENPNRIICVDHSFLGFDYGTKETLIKNASNKRYKRLVYCY